MLYFPLASPPEAVALQAALYWEKLCTIAPPWYKFRSPLLQELFAEGVLQPVDADRMLGRPSQVRAIVEDVYAALDDLPGRDLEPDPRLRGTASSRLYVGKLPLVVESELQELGVAVPGNDRVINAAPAVLSVVLSVVSRFLAPALDEEDGHRTSIFTDRARLVRQAVGALHHRQATAWQIQIGSVLPVPVAGSDPRLVLSFREKYADERQELSAAITELAATLTAGTDVDVQALKHRLSQAQGQVLRASRASHLQMAKRGMSILGAFGAATGAAAAGTPELVGLANVLSSLGLAYATTSVRDARSPFTYLAEARKHFTLTADGEN